MKGADLCMARSDVPGGGWMGRRWIKKSKRPGKGTRIPQKTPNMGNAPFLTQYDLEIWVKNLQSQGAVTKKYYHFFSLNAREILQFRQVMRGLEGKKPGKNFV